MQVSDLKLAGLKLFKPNVYSDKRGFFFESYRKPLFAELGLSHSFVQDNVSFSKKNTIRGLHFQEDQGKLVSVLKGQIFDVVVDVRPKSPTFGKWEALILDERNHYLLFVPKGFAHGFMVLSEDALVHYKVTSVYDPKKEKGIHWKDSEIKIPWPLEGDPILSDRDHKNPLFKEISP